MKRITPILITLMTFCFFVEAYSELSPIEREYQVYHNGKQIEFSIEVEDKNDDNTYDFIAIEINGKNIVDSKLTLVSSITDSKLFPRDTRISDITQNKCETSNKTMLSFGIYDFNSIQVAHFHFDCEKDEAFYDFNPEISNNGKADERELSFKTDDLSFLGVGLSPNPATTHINIVYDPEVVRDDITIRISDSNGSEVYKKKYEQKNIKKNAIKIDIVSFKNGLYEVELETLELSLILNFLKK